MNNLTKLEKPVALCYSCNSIFISEQDGLRIGTKCPECNVVFQSYFVPSVLVDFVKSFEDKGGYNENT